MGRPKGSKNHARAVEPALVEITEEERNDLVSIFTSIDKDIISIEDFQKSSGLSYHLCAKIIREIKGASDILHISGFVHRADYFIYLSRRFSVLRDDRKGDED